MSSKKSVRQRLALRASVVCLGLISMSVMGTSAGFTDSASSVIQLNAATVSLLINDASKPDYGTAYHESINISLTDIAPGQNRTIAFVLKNDTDAAFPVSLDTQTIAGGLGSRFSAVVRHVGGNVLFNGMMENADFTNGVVIQPGGTAEITYQISWVTGSDDNTWKGKTEQAKLIFTGTYGS